MLGLSEKIHNSSVYHHFAIKIAIWGKFLIFRETPISAVVKTQGESLNCVDQNSIHFWMTIPFFTEKIPDSMDWFKGKSTGNHGFYHQI